MTADTAIVRDGLAADVDFGARRGAGCRRAVVLGGGGLVAVAWQVAYLEALLRREIDLADADLIVGTSAGSVVGTLLAARRLATGTRELGWLAKLPGVAGAMASSTGLHPSQQRGLSLFRDSTSGDRDTVRTIGFAALAARTPPTGHLSRTFFAMTRARRWPHPGLRIVTADAYTGERLVLHGGVARVAVSTAAAASASVPGLFAPQPINDRRCIDGGTTGSATHCDVVAGATRVIALPLADSVPAPGMYCQRPESFSSELDRLREAGSVVEVRTPELESLAPESLMDPARIPGAIAAGQRQADRDAPALGAFWRA